MISRKQLILLMALSVISGYFGGVLSNVGFVFAKQQTLHSDVIQGKKLLLLGDSGKKRVEIRLRSSSGAPQMRFFDEDGKSRLELGLWGGNPHLVLNDTGGVGRLSFFLNTNEDPYVAFLDSKAKEAIGIAQLSGGKTFMRLHGPNMNKKVEIGINTWPEDEIETFFHLSE